MIRSILAFATAAALVLALAAVAVAADPNGATGHGADVSAVAKAVHTTQGNAHGKAVSAIASAHGKAVSAAAKARAAANKANGKANAAAGKANAAANKANKAADKADKADKANGAGHGNGNGAGASEALDDEQPGQRSTRQTRHPPATRRPSLAESRAARPAADLVRPWAASRPTPKSSGDHSRTLVDHGVCQRPWSRPDQPGYGKHVG